MPSLIVRDRARQDAAEIAHYIAMDNLDAALRVFGAIEDAFELLARMPGSGTKCELGGSELADLRFWPLRKYRNYLVIYRPLPDGAEIIRVIHGARDLPKTLRHG